MGGHLLAMCVRRFSAHVVDGRLDHPRLADPLSEGAQEAEVVVDRRRRQAPFQPAVDHRLDVSVRQLAGVEVRISRLVAQLSEEPEVEATAVLHRLDRHALVLGAVLVVVQRQQRAQDAQEVVRSHRQGLEDRFRRC